MESLSHSVCNERCRAPVVSHLSSPGIATSSISSADITGSGPYSEVGITPPPRLSPWSGELEASVPISRFSQPARVVEPGLASSTSSIAAKCERFGAGSPVACTAASLPAFQSGSSGARDGCSPNIASFASSRSEGIAIRGRAW